MLSSDLQKLSVSGLITLYELDATKLGGGVFRWHGHVSYEDLVLIFGYFDKTEYLDKNANFNAIDTGTEYKRDIIWQGNTYSPMPIKSDGLEMRGDGKASTPSLALANNIDGLQGAVSALCLQFDDFAGAKLRVINTSAEYLDAANFVSGNPQANANEFRQQIWYIEQKTSENSSVVAFELSNPVDFEGARIPSREITSFCHWAVHGRYRGHECAYLGTARFTEDGASTDDPALDQCGGRLSDCRLRNNSERFGGFPSSSLISN